MVLLRDPERIRQTTVSNIVADDRPRLGGSTAREAQRKMRRIANDDDDERSLLAAE
jgi:hypothetical protein